MNAYSPSEIDSLRADAYADCLPDDEQSEVDQATDWAAIEAQMTAWEKAGQPLDPADPFFAKPKTAKVWTADDIKALLIKNDEAVGRALVALLKRQTASEQNNHRTTDANGVGFNAFDADIFTSMAQFYKAKGFLTANQLAFLRSGTEKRPAPRINKYAGQLAAIANGVQAAL